MGKVENAQVDQSGKVEQTNVDTVLALANSNKLAIVLKRRDKRILKRMFKEIGKGKTFPYITFAALLAILLHFSKVKNKVVVDREYTGHENTIKERTQHFLKKLGHKDETTIEFGHVGKLSSAHDYAAKVGSKKLKPNRTVRLKDLLELISVFKPLKKTEVAKRLKKT